MSVTVENSLGKPLTELLEETGYNGTILFSICGGKARKMLFGQTMTAKDHDSKDAEYKPVLLKEK